MIPIIGELPPANELELLGRSMQQAARANPCYFPLDEANPLLSRMIGEDFRVTLALAVYPDRSNPGFPTPRWHASICALHTICRGNDYTFGLPEQAILRVKEWTADMVKNCRDILGYCLGAVIIERTQVVIQFDGLFSMHFLTVADPRTIGLEEHDARVN
jgi:hypothetical protein